MRWLENVARLPRLRFAVAFVGSVGLVAVAAVLLATPRVPTEESERVAPRDGEDRVCPASHLAETADYDPSAARPSNERTTRMHAQRGSRSFRIVAFDPLDAPISGARIVVVRADSARTRAPEFDAPSGPNGVAEVSDLRAGRYDCVAISEESGIGRVEIDYPECAGKDVVIRTSASASIHGRLLTGQAPAAGVAIHLESIDPLFDQEFIPLRSMFTDESGSFAFDEVASDRSGIGYRLRSDCGFAATLHVSAGDAIALPALNCETALKATVVGMLVDASGPVVERSVEIAQFIAGRSGAYIASAQTDSAGRFVLRAVPPGHRELRVAGACAIDRNRIRVEIAKGTALVDVGVIGIEPPSESIHGQVRFDDGTPAEGATVRIADTEAIADAAGRFKLTSCAGSGVEIVATWTDPASRTDTISTSATTRGAEHPVDLVLERGGLVLEVLDATTHLPLGVPSLKIACFRKGVAEAESQITLRQPGATIRLKDFTPGQDYSVFVSADGYEGGGIDFRLPAESKLPEIRLGISLRRK